MWEELHLKRWPFTTTHNHSKPPRTTSHNHPSPSTCDNKSSFKKLHRKDKSVKIQKQKPCKVLLQKSARWNTDFHLYNIRRHDLFRSRNINSVHHGTDSLTYPGPKIWDIVPQVIKNSESLSVFKTKIKQWIPINCSWKLCRPYVQYVGYIWKFLTFHPDLSAYNGQLMRFSFLKHFVLDALRLL